MQVMIEQDDDLQFEQLIRDKQHKELLQAINGLSSAVLQYVSKEEKQDDENIIKAIYSVRESIADMPKEKIELRNDDTHHMDMINAVSEMTRKLSENILSLRHKEEKEWEFDILRTDKGNIDKVRVKLKNK